MTVRTATMPDAAEEERQRYLRLAAFGGLAVTIARLIWLAAAPIDLYADEAQYWFWSLHPALGYYSKPPLIAWVIALTTGLLGDGELAIRLGAPVIHFATSLLVHAIGERLYGPRVGGWAALAYVTLPGVSFSSLLISTDVPLLLFWALALYAFIRAREPGGDMWWRIVGLACGLGLLSKYAMAYWMISALLFTLAVPEERRHRPRLLFALALGLIVYSPNFFWNVSHGWASYAHTRDNANLGASLIHPTAFLEFLFSQFGVFGPVFFGALLWIAASWRRWDRRDLMLATFALPTLAMMLVMSFLSRAHPNWSAPAYVSAVVLVVAWLLRYRNGLLVKASIALHVAVVVVLLGAHDAARAAGIALPTKYDALHRLRGWSALGRSVSPMLLARPGAKLLSDDREEMAELLYYVRPHPLDAVKWNPVGRIHDQFDLTTDMAQHVGENFVFVTQEPDTRWIADKFDAFAQIGQITVPIGPDRARHYFVYEARGFKGYR